MSRSYWIWHYGEYEIYHTMMMNLRRQEFGADLPPFWQVSSPAVVIQFEKQISAPKEGYLIAHTTGKGYIQLGQKRYPMERRVTLPAGDYTVAITVCKHDGLPALFVESDLCPSDGSWLSNDCVSESAPVDWQPQYDAVDVSPETFPFAYQRREPAACQRLPEGTLWDFGNEYFGFLNVENADPACPLTVHYGESREEALDIGESVLWETVQGAAGYRLRQRAVRYVFIPHAPAELTVTLDYEYLPLAQPGTFSCDNELFNDVYRTCVHTFHLNCREAFLDGIKRDRWLWSGDAFQSARINRYLFADPAIVRRSALGLIGKPPVAQHLNGIVDYSMLWILGLWEYYLHYGDAAFIRRVFPRATQLLAFCEERCNEEGFIVGHGKDWTFIDWAEIDKTGAVCAEQILLTATYEAMAALAQAIDEPSQGYRERAASLKDAVNAHYWDEKKGGFIDSYESGRRNVTRHANIFAVMFGIATPAQTESIRRCVLKNETVPPITTPYFKGYELDVLGMLGEFDAIEGELTSYWGAMLACGATTVWEEFDPRKSGVEHYAMYGDRYTKSLCHAWGAGPIYLFGRYYLGVAPTAPGFATFTVTPNAGSLASFTGTVPVGEGTVTVTLEAERLRVLATCPGGTLRWQGAEYPLIPGEERILKR